MSQRQIHTLKIMANNRVKFVRFAHATTSELRSFAVLYARRYGERVQITILRHGKPDFLWERIVRGSEVKALQQTYNASGIIDNPPPELQTFAEQYNFVVSSDLLRSVQSAKAVGASAIHLSGADFREMGIPCFDSVSIKLPIKLWVVILRVLWVLGYSKNTESFSAAKRRAKLVSEILAGLACKHISVLFVGHGTLNYFVAKELLANGWVGPSNPGTKHWEFGTYHPIREAVGSIPTTQNNLVSPPT